MIGFIDDHRPVEPICKIIPIAPSTYHANVARRAHSFHLPDRVRCDADLKVEIRRVFEENFRVYGVRKIWRQLRRGGAAARCTVAPLMRNIGLRRAIRGKPLRTTISDRAALRPLDHVNRQFHASAPDRLWLLSDRDPAFVLDALEQANSTASPAEPEERYSPMLNDKAMAA